VSVSDDEKTVRVFMVSMTLLAVVLAGVLMYSCETQRDRRAQCIQQGRSASECKDAFSP
jgi:hypothetical protein